MDKGNMGIKLSFYAIVAFLVAATGGMLTLFVLAGFVFVVEKNKWLNNQILQAVLLCGVEDFIYAITNMIDKMVNPIPFVNNIWGIADSWVYFAVSTIAFVFAIVGMLNVSKGQDANIPVISKWAEWAVEEINQ